MVAMSKSYRSDDSYACYRKSIPARCAEDAGSPHWCTFTHVVYDDTIEEIVDQRKRICKDLAPRALLVTGHEAKKDLVRQLAGGAAYQVEPRLPWSGSLQETTKLRKEILAGLVLPEEKTDDEDRARRYLKSTVKSTLIREYSAANRVSDIEEVACCFL